MLLTDSQGIGIDSAPVVLSCAAGKGPGSSRHRGSEGVWCSGALVCAFGGGAGFALGCDSVRPKGADRVKW